MTKSNTQQSKKNRKVGRNADYCRFYAASHRREKNKILRLKKHLKKFPGDNCAVTALKVAKASILERIDD